MTEKLSHQEHAARAMLLGRVYDWRDGTYCKPDYDGTGLSLSNMLDCETLNQIETDVQRERLDASMGGKLHDASPPPRPWARED